MLLPYLARSLTLARLAVLHARREFEQGHWQAGWQDVSDVLKLARHVSTNPDFLLTSLVIEATALEAATPYLPELKTVIPPGALESLPARPNLPHIIQLDKETGPLWVIQELKNAERREPGSWRTFWKKVYDLSEPSPSLAALQAVQTLEEALRSVEDGLPLYDQLTTLAALPWKEFDARYPEFVKKARAEKPIGSLLLPGLDRFLAAERRSRAQLQLFQAALAVVRGGPDKLKEIADPFGTGPFEYRALEKGFELQSKLLYQGKPVTLTVGQAKKAP
jgi:hypothetical protein